MNRSCRVPRDARNGTDAVPTDAANAGTGIILNMDFACQHHELLFSPLALVANIHSECWRDVRTA